MSLDPLTLPSSPPEWQRFLRERCDDSLTDAASHVAALKETGPGEPRILEIWNDVQVDLHNAMSAASLFAEVLPDPDQRRQADEALAEARRFSTDLFLDAEVFARLDSLDESAYDDAGRRVLAHAIRDFRRAGVDRDEGTRQRLREINARETRLRQEFARNLRDASGTTRVPADALAGTPEDFVEAHPPDADGQVALSTAYPDTLPFLTYATDAEARRAVMTTFLRVGWPENDRVLSELFAVRAEHASVLGYDGWPDFDAEVKMIGDGKSIASFIDQVADDARAAGEREVADLLGRAREDDPAAVVDVANARYYTEVVRRENHAVDAQQVRRYFDFASVRQGLLDVTGRLFGLEYTAVPDAPVWHEEVTAYDVALDGDPLGRIYLDLHPRDGKYSHAAQFDLVAGIAGRQLPEGVLVCNFPRGLMEHSDVVTLFHEFGHLLHHVLAGRHAWVAFSGVATEWDFVEAPSQMLEEWAWDAGVLSGFARDPEGNPISADLVQRMRAAKDVGKAVNARTQMFYAAVSYRLHLERPEDLTARVLELYDEYNLVRPLPETHFHCGFGHLEGYSSAYYTYMWSLVIAKDLFSAFDPDDLFAPEVATRYRDTVLTPGGSRDAADLVEAFLGRPYSSEAFATWLER